MKKIFLILCTICLLLTGCNSNSTEDEALTAYATSYKAVMDNSKWLSTSQYFTLSAEMSSLPNGNYNYYIFIDTPTVALYDIRTIAVENNAMYGETEKMMPTLGIFENATYSMVPNQVNTAEGFVKGLVMSGQVSEPNVDIKMMVSWMDVKRNSTTREFFSFTITMEGVVYPNTNVEDVTVGSSPVPSAEPSATPESDITSAQPTTDGEETPITSVDPEAVNSVKPTAIIPSEVTYPDYDALSTPLPTATSPTGYVEGKVNS